MRHFQTVRKRIAGLAFGAGGKTLMPSVRGRWDVPVWDLDTGTSHLWDPDVDAPVRSLASSPDGNWVGVGDEVGQVFAYQCPDLVKREDFSFGGTERPWIHSIAFGWTEDRADCRIAFAADNGTLCVATMGGTAEAEVVPVPGSMIAVAFSPDGQLLAAVDESYFAVRLWNAWTARPAGDVELKQEPRSACFTADGRAVAVAVASRVELRGADGLHLRHTCSHGARVTQVAAHPSRNVVASAGTDGIVRFWDADAGKEEAAYDWKLGRATAVAFSPDGLTCAAGGEDGQVVVWDVDE